jgi:hypothetical protein
MHDISEHNPKEEGESDDCEHSWIDFLEYGNTISVNDFLERHSKLIAFKECWLHKSMITFIISLNMVDLGAINVPCLPHPVNLVPHLLAELGWTPHQPHEESLTSFEHVELTVNCFLLENKPLVNLNERIL